MRYKFRYTSILAILYSSVCDAKNLHCNDNTFQRRDIGINQIKVGKFKRQSNDGKYEKIIYKMGNSQYSCFSLTDNSRNTCYTILISL